MPRFFLRACLLTSVLAAAMPAAAQDFEIEGKSTTLSAEVVAQFNEPWAMTFLPDGTMLVTTLPGKLFHVTQTGEKTEVANMWNVAYGGQGGLGDVVLHPDFKENRLVYISSVESIDGASFGAIVARARLEVENGGAALKNIEKIWTQEPKMPGHGHFSHRIAFSPDGHLFITSGDRQKQKPAQNKDQALGKIIRLNPDGSVPGDNPWQDQGELAKTYWTTGHRNMLGIAFDGEGRLWVHEMGPEGGDELNLIEKGKNYGWPIVSNGINYSGVPIPDHDTRDQFAAPKVSWNPVISPAGLVIYDGDAFTDWKGDALIGGLSSKALVRVDLDGAEATEAERFEWGQRVREVEQGPDGGLWVLEDGKKGSKGRLLKLTPKGES